MKKSLQEGKVTLAQINKACERILISKYQLGLFDDPYRYCNEQRSATEVLRPLTELKQEGLQHKVLYY